MGTLARTAADEVVRAAIAAIAARRRFTVVLSGGSTPARLFELLAADPYRSQMPWSATHVYWGDERCVPPDHPESNYRMAAEKLLDHVPIPAANVHRIRAELPPEEAAALYEADLQSLTPISDPPVATSPPQPVTLRPSDPHTLIRSPRHAPSLDLVLLGMGPDGHTASLFPGTAALEERDRLVVANHVPKLATHRITLTVPALNAGRAVVFLVAGADKAAMVKRVLEGEPAQVPAQLVQPTSGNLLWLLDAAAAAQLGNEAGGQ
ncbi:MAG: 6-phosphogluconolactonase [Chloroflexi bacterium]|nr:6-phosphogluconolactonase [Chloroflexota bacterium]